ncbi:histidine phosphatase family protein [Xylophilus sp. ASV27]|uniref:histidine phosphatase family protein n=1 Tax=Xylophilus sp. ASV27 TaxID=2795129 RepID=UPI0018EBC4AA|nr:histidine phosphatase family protein [Xylophilus sp. ASV27]
MPTDLILVRHGETDANLERRFQGQVDRPLNATGHAQALRLAQRLAGSPPDLLWSSDLARARETAMPVAAQTGLVLATDAGLREQNFGVVDGMRVDDIQRDFPEAWQRWTQFRADCALPGGESTRDFHARVIGALRRVAAAHAGRSVLVVTHGGVLDMVYRTARALSLDGPRTAPIPNAGINRVRVAGEALQILAWADTAHLAGLPPQPVYDQARLARAAPVREPAARGLG